MATRRPKVPRATPAAPKPADTGDGAHVIQADFSSRAAPAGKPAGAAAGQPAGRPATDARSSGSPAPGNRTTGAPDAGKAPAEAGAAPTRKRKPAAKPGTGKPEENLDPVPARALSGRLLALGVVMIAITIMLAPTVKIFLDKRAEISALQADISAKQSQQNDLKRQVTRWQDPNYVKQQARDRINMVMPGETGYWVFGSDLPAGQSGAVPGAASAQDPAQLPWVDSLWESIRRSATD
ncbi:MAG: septum formation initiator family protein [Arthrobacter sp.]|nr:septum formation initiator family protein [Arthrobacter sp.]